MLACGGLLPCRAGDFRASSLVIVTILRAAAAYDALAAARRELQQAEAAKREAAAAAHTLAANTHKARLELEGLRRETEQAAAERDEVAAATAEQQQLLAASKDAAARLGAEAGEMRASIETTTRRRAQLEADVAALEQRRRQEQSQLDDSMQRRQLVEEELSTMLESSRVARETDEQERCRWQEEAAAARRRLQEEEAVARRRLREELEAEKARQAEVVRAEQERIRLLQDEAVEVVGRIEDLRRQSAAAETECQQLKLQERKTAALVSEAEARRARLDTDLVALQQRRDAAVMEAEGAAAAADVSLDRQRRAESDARGAREEEGRRRAAMRQLEDETRQLEDAVGALRAERDRVRNECEHMHARVSEVQGQLEKEEARLGLVKSEAAEGIRHTNGQLSLLQDTVLQKQQMLADLGARLEESSGQLQTLTATMKKQQHECERRVREHEAAERRAADGHKAAAGQLEKAEAERQSLEEKLQGLQRECDEAEASVRVLQGREAAQRRALEQLDARAEEGERQLRELEGKVSDCRAEHRAALTALGAARASKDAALRESAAAAAATTTTTTSSSSSSAAAARHDAASQLTEWEVKALASLRVYVEQRRLAARRCSPRVAEEELGGGADEIVVMAACEFAALRDRDRQRDDKMQRLQVSQQSPASRVLHHSDDIERKPLTDVGAGRTRRVPASRAVVAAAFVCSRCNCPARSDWGRGGK